MDADMRLADAVAAVPAGAWAVGVSGGADSVALLALLRTRADLKLHVVHLDHQTRAGESAADAAFVHSLAERWGLPSTVDTLAAVNAPAAANASARYRLARLTLFRRVVTEHWLAGVVLAHHADDRAETVLHRLLRGSGIGGLAPLAPMTDLAGLHVLRPLLGVRRDDLRTYLRSIGQDWREDASNASDRYLRNRLRRLLSRESGLNAGLLEFADACSDLVAWVRQAAPVLDEAFDVRRLSTLPNLLAAESARRWLTERGVPPGAASPGAIDRLIRMAADAASPPRMTFPGFVSVARRGGRIFVEATTAGVPPSTGASRNTQERSDDP